MSLLRPVRRVYSGHTVHQGPCLSGGRSGDPEGTGVGVVHLARDGRKVFPAGPLPRRTRATGSGGAHWVGTQRESLALVEGAQAGPGQTVPPRRVHEVRVVVPVEARRRVVHTHDGGPSRPHALRLDVYRPGVVLLGHYFLPRRTRPVPVPHPGTFGPPAPRRRRRYPLPGTPILGPQGYLLGTSAST